MKGVRVYNSKILIMLELFKIRNFMSFKDEAFLDLRATVLKQHLTHLIQPEIIYDDAKNGLLKTIAIYGANASGKSNLISALYSMQMFVLSQLYMNKNSDNAPFELEPFYLCDKKDTTEFEIVFRYNGKRIQYGFEILISDRDDKAIIQKIVSEWYYIDDEQVFDRKSNEIDYGTKYEKVLKKYNKVPSDRIYISVLDYFLDDTQKEIVVPLIDYFRKSFNVFSQPLIDFSVKKTGSFSVISRRLIKDQNFRNKVVDYLKRIDIGIDDLIVVDEQEADSENERTEKQKEVKTQHTTYSQDNEINGKMLFDLSKESSGTLRFLTYIQNIITIQESGGVFIVDELSAKLHPLLTKFIIDIFQSSSNKSAQLIFSTHDVYQLTKEQFRRDEVVLVDKNDRGESSITSLAKLKVREDSTFNKDYINGKYGAIPILKDALDILEEKE